MSKGYSFAGIPSKFLPKFVSFHVNVASGGKIVAHAVWKGRIPDPVGIDLPNKIRLEIGHWIGVFLRLSDPEQARLLGDRTRQTFGGMDRESISRTLRCLRALEGFLVGSSFYRIPNPKWRNRIVQALNKPDGEFLLPGTRPGFRVAASLLLIRAVAWSQSGWNQPYLWEAYSSLQARQDHEEWLAHREVSRDGGQAARRLVELLAYLVRFQSAPGQLERKTGDAGFLDQAEKLGVGKKVALTLLGVVAWALDFRNRDLPVLGNQPPPDEETDLVRGVGVYKHKKTNWSRAMAILEGSIKPDRKRLKTWSYTKWLTDASDSRRNFQDFQDRIEGESPADLTNYSFGRDYHSPQHHTAMAAAIKGILKEPTSLHETLRFDTLQVPHWEADGTYEKVQIIRLPAEIGAAYSVFAEPAAAPPVPGAPSSGFLAWSIFLHLFRTAKEIRHIQIRDIPKAVPDDFCPAALIGRFLEVCHAIAPQDCISIPVRVNDQPLDFIHLPKVPEELAPDGPEVGIVARYVPAYVLNHVLTRYVQYCDVGLRMLSEVKGGSFWYPLIEKAIRENHFRLLLEDYLNDYRAEPSAVDLQKSSFDLFSRAAPGSNRLGDDLKILEKHWKSLLFAGIDIGGTLTKIQVYKLSFKSGRISLVPFRDKKPVKILTRFDNGPGKPSPTDPAGHARAFSQKVADKIREILGSHPRTINGVGVAWPGPVRNNRIQGTSGILFKLGFSKQITENDIAEIMRLPLAEILAERIFGRPAPLEEPFGPHQPPVAILNDGDAHALAVLSPYALNQIRKPGKGVVVKLGTGTAGAVVSDGNLDAGLMEFGKIVVNLAAKAVGNFPSGLATKYVSAEALQRYAKERFALLNAETPRLHPEIRAIEIGLLAGLTPNVAEETKRSGLREIRWQSGVIHLAALLEQAVGESEVVLDAAELNRLRDFSEWTLRDPTREEVLAKLGILQLEGAESFEEYIRRVNGCGTTRLQTILGLRHQEKRDFQDFLESGALGRDLSGKINRVARTCRSAVKELGERLADLLALLYGELGMDYAMLGGGVLSGKTGKTALASAFKRFRHYSWFSVLERNPRTESGDNITLDFKRNTLAAPGKAGPPPEHAPQSPIDDHGTLGAAVWGAREYVRQIRLAGLQKVSEKVQRLHLTESLSLEPGRVRAGENDPAAIDLDQYSLKVEDVLRYLDDSARVLGVVRTRTDPRKPEYVFTRWLGA